MPHGEPSTQACISLESCFSFENLMDAAAECRRSSPWKRQVQAFMSRRATECRRLQRELAGGTYRATPAARFRIVERGKPREVKSVAFRDRVVQRCLCDQVLAPRLQGLMPPCSSACLEGRGLTYAYRSVRRMVGDAPPDAWVLQYDFSGYFASIDHGRLLSLMRPVVPDARLFSLLAYMVEGEEVGLELGSHVSQLCAAYYPAPLDAAMSASRGCLGYHRYMDDGVAVYATRADALAGLSTLEQAAQALGLTLNARKTHVNRIAAPFVFCKMRFEKKPGRVKMNVTKRQSRRSAKHWKAVKRRAERHEVELGPVRASVEGYLNRGDADLSRLVT